MKNVKTIFLFFLVIIVFILFYLVIKGFMQENIQKSSDLIKIEIKRLMKKKTNNVQMDCMFIKIKSKSLILLLGVFLSLLSSNAFSKEVGDIVYYPLERQWGAYDHYSFPKYIGHAGIYIGTDENGDDWIIHNPGVTVIKEMVNSGYKFLNTSQNTSTRKNVISFAHSRLVVLFKVKRYPPDHKSRVQASLL